MKETEIVKFRNEYARLTAKRSGIDHELAKLAHDIRAKFADGERGRAEAVEVAREITGRQLAAARSFIVDGEAWGCVRNVDHWIAIGGLNSARLIMTLAPKQRLVVLSEAVAKADKRKRPISTGQVRDIAWRHGFVEKEAPKVTEAKKAATLTAFVNRLYALGISGLPPMPADVRAIVKPTRAAVAKAA